MSNKAVFLDRDDTLIKDPGYINDPDQVELLAGVSEALVELREMGYKRVIVTNQSGVARGIVTEAVLRKIHKRLEKLLEHQGAGVESIYYCPYHPDGVIEKYRAESDLRKPNAGMILKAAKDMDIDLEQSWVVGNSYRDIAAGQRAGCKTILINSTINQTYRRPTDPIPDKQAVNIKEAVNIIKMHKRVNRPVDTTLQQKKIESIFTSEVPDRQVRQKEQPVEAPVKAKEPPAKVKAKEEVDASRTHKLLEEMLRHIKEMKREGMFEEFSLAKVIAGIVQALVMLCLFLSLLFLTDPAKGEGSVHTMIGYAIVLQLMVIAFYIMRDRK
ncbi:MAG: D-glycero-alpha-D-manno-heptose-1,7-bisphosphate 7-phosphatase [Planctomycetota bacterium]|jgi:D,D-heptose 1,7-bisphosphate phosphatase